jgi:hypothetical protein
MPHRTGPARDNEPRNADNYHITTGHRYSAQPSEDVQGLAIEIINDHGGRMATPTAPPANGGYEHQAGFRRQTAENEIISHLPDMVQEGARQDLTEALGQAHLDYHLALTLLVQRAQKAQAAGSQPEYQAARAACAVLSRMHGLEQLHLQGCDYARPISNAEEYTANRYAEISAAGAVAQLCDKPCLVPVGEVGAPGHRPAQPTATRGQGR